MNETNSEGLSDISGQVEEFLTVWFKVRQSIQGLNAGRSQQLGLSISQFMVLALLEESARSPVNLTGSTLQNSQTITSLANRLNLDPASVLRSVDSLEKRGLIERQRSKKDRRFVFIQLTDEGRQLQNHSYSGFKDRLALIFQAMSAEGREALVKGFQEFAAVSQLPVEGSESPPLDN